jgi:hypothetical protein
MPAPKKTFEEKPGDSLGRFREAVKQILTVPKKEIERREIAYQQTKKTTQKHA